MIKTLPAFFILAALAACAAPGIDANAVTFTTEGKTFKGEAGADISVDALQDDRLYGLCPGTPEVRDLTITRRPDGSVAFSGRCA
ncbi:hypothetical protein KDD17_10630 [Sulfitobacter albidus]|uniref:Uncharacterized protein n=1 Tax=Sulfitobacter albidus TaxID=2829501 RepID=A0A975JBY0_9RHOB|nr:hypothetical protein [Sulfitobacter albidus]QUJ75430.1 hypothetical protein KDD17_10630 [Sulfitobacter albidus]